MKTCLALLLAASLLPAPAMAQTGPFTEGEFLVRTVNMLGQQILCRVNPETGNTAVLAMPLGWATGPGVMTFDSHRGGVVANCSFAPDGFFNWRLWIVSHDGTKVALPGIEGVTGSVRALASTGDGRIFFILHTSSSQGPKTVEYFDANNVIHTLKQADGVTPFQIEVEHLLYHAPTNSLIGSSSAFWALTDCGPLGGSLYRIPLSADGLRVDGPVTCAPSSNVANFEEIMSLDHMPGGKVLVTMASGGAFAPANLASFDPVTMTVTGWANPDENDINGGCWSGRLGKAVIYTRYQSLDQFRTFSAGSGGLGGVIPTSMALPQGDGYSPVETMIEIDANGPACDGFQIPYGTGLAGFGSPVPVIGAIGCVDIGETYTLSITSVVGGASGFLFAGPSPTSVPFKGGTFLVGGVALQLPLTLGGTPGTPGAGSLALPVLVTNPVLSGVSIYLQAGFIDAGAVKGVSLTNGLRIQGN